MCCVTLKTPPSAKNDLGVLGLEKGIEVKHEEKFFAAVDGPVLVTDDVITTHNNPYKQPTSCSFRSWTP